MYSSVSGVEFAFHGLRNKIKLAQQI